MKRLFSFFKWSIISILGLILAIVILVYSRQHRTFDAPYPEIAASKDSSVIAHGKYLFFGPAHCMDCHATMEDIEKVDNSEKSQSDIRSGNGTWKPF
jgi:hypothetical protein